MWDGFDLPGEVRRHQLSEPLSAEAPVALVGSSYGGLVCLDFAARHPELVTALVLLDAPLPDHDWSDEVSDLRGGGRAADGGRRPRRGHRAGPRFLGPEHGATRLRPMQERAGRWSSISARIEEVDLSAVSAPTLVAVGEQDKADFHAIADRLVRELPNAEHAVIPDAGHLPSMEQPEATAALVSRFLEGKT